MGKQYDNTNTGVLFKNDRKETDKHPDLNGSINVEGKEYFLSGWKKTSKDGSRNFVSLSVTAKDQKPSGSKKPSKPADEDDFT